MKILELSIKNPDPETAIIGYLVLSAYSKDLFECLEACFPQIKIFCIGWIHEKSYFRFRYQLHGSTKLNFYKALNLLNKVFLGQNLIAQLTKNAKQQLDTINVMIKSKWYTQNFPDTDLSVILTEENFKKYFKSFQIKIIESNI